MLLRPLGSTLFPYTTLFRSVYSALWGLIGVWAVFALVRRFSERLIVPATAAACFIFLPIVINRSEEHTSELQSRLHLVCRLLLEKKTISSEDGQDCISCLCL